MPNSHLAEIRRVCTRIMTRNVREKPSFRILDGGPVFNHLVRKPCCRTPLFTARALRSAQERSEATKSRVGMKSRFGLRDALCGQCSVGWLGLLFRDCLPVDCPSTSETFSCSNTMVFRDDDVAPTNWDKIVILLWLTYVLECLQ